jgi:5-formyltetrahydrofolate cyclo-ligase
MHQVAKAELRQRVLARRDALAPERRASLSAAIFQAIRALPAFATARSVLGYSSFGSEPVTAPFLEAVLDGGKTLVLPRVDRASRRLALHRVTAPGAELRPGVWGILEPDPARCPPAALEAVDFVLVPGVVFDVEGGRIGYGAGYYDRLLGECAAGTALVAAAFELQVVEAVPMAEHDRRVDRVVTEHRVYSRGGVGTPPR